MAYFGVTPAALTDCDFVFDGGTHVQCTWGPASKPLGRVTIWSDPLVVCGFGHSHSLDLPNWSAVLDEEYRLEPHHVATCLRSVPAGPDDALS
ncbi:hypothetical protein LAZ40_00785 [Cereibacter sphaeroides]|uniref:hypothetical protein n=1 Tax=Cereibacter sphaeroides TaxID=1063 RepID=UPI001F20E335|nr:hypothetical protein [Cereibacter sphaeroides]MCE6957606.1 hypothetical protein [Cereibacter sphaeroides]MCE6971309.1 hypothetical protein [Cereibacter sphaeroides]